MRESIKAQTGDNTGDSAKGEEDGKESKEDEKQARNKSEGAEQNVVRAELKVQLQVTWHKVRFSQMPEWLTAGITYLLPKSINRSQRIIGPLLACQLCIRC
jgi:hypothetical protein